MTEQEQQEHVEKVKAVADAARKFLKVYDEFMPEYPEAVGEYLDALIDAIDRTGD